MVDSPDSVSPLRRRLERWEGRLATVIESARSKPYQLGEHDCFRVACAAVEALTGVDFWKDWAGTYRTRRQALRRIAAYGGDFTSAFSRLFGVQPQPMAMARRGDIVEFRDEQGEQHLGVVIGAEVAMLGETGLMFVKRSACSHCWRIG